MMISIVSDDHVWWRESTIEGDEDEWLVVVVALRYLRRARVGTKLTDEADVDMTPDIKSLDLLVTFKIQR